MSWLGVLLADAADLYLALSAEFGSAVDNAAVAEMREKTKKIEEEIDAKVKDAEENLGGAAALAVLALFLSFSRCIYVYMCVFSE